MMWLRAHAYAVALALAGILFLAGVFIVLEKIAPRNDSPVRAWGGAGGYLLDATASEIRPQAATQENIFSNVQGGPPFQYTPFSITNTPAEDELDIETLLGILSSPSEQPSFVSENSLDAYSFIPSGLVSADLPQKTLTPTQQSIYEYGNQAGSSIQSFEGSFRNGPQILKDQFEDREDPEKNERLLALARGLSSVGSELERLEGVPTEVATSHAKVAASYKELGAKLSSVQAAKTDEAVLDAIVSYNTTVELYVKNYVALATLISAHGVTFSPEDPGSIFTFTNSSL